MAAQAGGGGMNRWLAAINTFDAWLDRRQLRWQTTISTGIICRVVAILITGFEMVQGRELPTDITAMGARIVLAALLTAFCAGLAAEWIGKRIRRAEQ